MGQIQTAPHLGIGGDISLDGLHAVTKTSEWKNNGSVLIIKTWEIKTGKELSLIEIPGRATDYLSISHDGRMVIVRWLSICLIDDAHWLDYGWLLAWWRDCCGGCNREF